MNILAYHRPQIDFSMGMIPIRKQFPYKRMICQYLVFRCPSGTSQIMCQSSTLRKMDFTLADSELFVKMCCVLVVLDSKQPTSPRFLTSRSNTGVDMDSFEKSCLHKRPFSPASTLRTAIGLLHRSFLSFLNWHIHCNNYF